MKKNIPLIVVVIILSLILVFSLVFNSGGIPNTPPTETVPVPTNTSFPTATPDPCSPENIQVQVARVHLLMREFDDTSLLAQTTLLQNVVPLVQDMQAIRRTAEDQAVPSCMADLKQYQLEHMNMMIEIFTTALAFHNAFGVSGDQQALDSLTMPMLEQARLSLEKYVIEYSRLMGFTPFPTPTVSGTDTLAPQP